MGLLEKLFGKKNNNANWLVIKTSEMVYPQKSISILMLKTKSGKMGTGWVDKAYDKYAYKEFCPYNFLIMVDLKDSIAQLRPDLDMETIETFFVEELRKICIAHIVGRLVSDEGINLEMYLEKEKPVMKHLQNILSDSNRLVSFNCEVNKDPEWSAVSGLMNL